MYKIARPLAIVSFLGLTACASNTSVPLPQGGATMAPAASAAAGPASAEKGPDGVLGLWGLHSASNPGGMQSSIYLSVRKASQIDASLVRVSGFSGVNYYTGNARIDASQQRFILVSPIATTQVADSNEKMKAEQLFLGDLDRVVSFQISTSELTLTTLTGEQLVFQRQGN